MHSSLGLNASEHCGDGNLFASSDTQEIHPSSREQPFYEVGTMIPQIDGALDDSVLSDGSLISVTNSHSVSSLVAQYTLNQHKQLSGLHKHSLINDFEMVINDSGRNINIQCNTGFYEAVVKPSLSSLSTRFQAQVDTVLIECTESRNLVDMAANLPGLLLKFKVYGSGVSPSPASLSVHLHHTQQKVQVQGGASMPSNTTAAAWFVDKVLKDRFTMEARNKRFDIDNINKLVSNLPFTNPLSSSTPSSIPSCCPHCKKKFSSTSKPVSCPKCSLFRHKAKCSPCPVSSSNTSPVVFSTPVSISTSNCLTLPPLPAVTAATATFPNVSLSEESSQPLVKKPRYTVSNSVPQVMTVSPPVSDSVLPTSTRELAIYSSSVTPVFSSVSLPLFSVTAQNVSSAVSLSSMSSSTTVTATLAPGPILSTRPQASSAGISATRKRKSNPKSPTKSAEQAEIDFLKLELNAVRTQLIDLESSKADLERKNKIMNDVIKMHEQRQASQAYSGISHDFLQPSHPPQQLSEPQCHPGSHSHPCHLSCRIRSCNLPHNNCCSPPCGCPSYPANSSPPDSNLGSLTDLYRQLKSEIKIIRDEIVDIVNKIDSIASPIAVTTQERPLYRNPVEIPNYDEMEISEAPAACNVSLVSADEFVPDVTVPMQDTEEHATIPLN